MTVGVDEVEQPDVDEVEEQHTQEDSAVETKGNGAPTI